MESLNFNHSNFNNIEEILGFFHHQLSQHSKDIGLLNSRVADLIKQSQISDHSTVVSFINASNTRLDGYGASILSLTDQIVQNQNVNIQNMESFKSNIRNEIKDEIKEITKEIEDLKQNICKYNFLNSFNENDTSNDNILINNNTTLKKHKKKKGNIKKFTRSPNNKLHINKNSNVSVNETIIDIKPRTNSSHDENLTNDIENLKKSMGRHENTVTEKLNAMDKKINDFSIKFRNLMDAAILNIRKELDQQKNEDSNIMQAASLESIDSLVEYQPKRTKPYQNNDFKRQTNIKPSPRKTQTHYTLINGDCLKRPGTQFSANKACRPMKPY